MSERTARLMLTSMALTLLLASFLLGSRRAGLCSWGVWRARFVSLDVAEASLPHRCRCVCTSGERLP